MNNSRMVRHEGKKASKAVKFITSKLGKVAMLGVLTTAIFGGQAMSGTFADLDAQGTAGQIVNTVKGSLGQDIKAAKDSKKNQINADLQGAKDAIDSKLTSIDNIEQSQLNNLIQAMNTSEENLVYEIKKQFGNISDNEVQTIVAQVRQQASADYDASLKSALDQYLQSKGISTSGN